MPIGEQIAWLLLLALPVASIAWTVTHEEVFREARNRFIIRSRRSEHLYQRKFFYFLTCEYCFSHYVAIFFVLLSGYRLLLPDWRGFIIAIFALVWVANMYMSLYGMIRMDLKRERVELEEKERNH